MSISDAGCKLFTVTPLPFNRSARLKPKMICASGEAQFVTVPAKLTLLAAFRSAANGRLVYQHVQGVVGRQHVFGKMFYFRQRREIRVVIKNVFVAGSGFELIDYCFSFRCVSSVQDTPASAACCATRFPKPSVAPAIKIVLPFTEFIVARLKKAISILTDAAANGINE